MFYGKDADPMSVLNDAKQYPTFAEKRVVIVREAQDFKVKDWETFEKIQSMLKDNHAEYDRNKTLLISLFHYTLSGSGFHVRI